MKYSANFLFSLFLAFVVTSCNTYNSYFVASPAIPVNIFTTNTGTQVAHTVPAGSVLLLRGQVKNGLTQVRFHSDPNWYWVNYANLSLVPGVDPKTYDQTYVSIESELASTGVKTASGTTVTNGGYDATIQTGLRGGKYYINKNGNKTYVPRSTPSGSTKHVGGKGSRGGKH